MGFCGFGGGESGLSVCSPAESSVQSLRVLKIPRAHICGGALLVSKRFHLSDYRIKTLTCTCDMAWRPYRAQYLTSAARSYRL